MAEKESPQIVGDAFTKKALPKEDINIEKLESDGDSEDGFNLLLERGSRPLFGEPKKPEKISVLQQDFLMNPEESENSIYQRLRDAEDAKSSSRLHSDAPLESGVR